MVIFHIGFPKTGTTSLQYHWANGSLYCSYNPTEFDAIWKEIYFNEFFTCRFHNVEYYRRKVTNWLSSVEGDIFLSYESVLGFNPHYSKKRLEFITRLFDRNNLTLLVTLPDSIEKQITKVFKHKTSECFAITMDEMLTNKSDAHAGFDIAKIINLEHAINHADVREVVMLKPSPLLQNSLRLNSSEDWWLNFVLKHNWICFLNRLFYGRRLYGVLINLVKKFILIKDHSKFRASASVNISHDWIASVSEGNLYFLKSGSIQGIESAAPEDLINIYLQYHVRNSGRI